MAYGDFKDSARRTASDKVLRDTAFNLPKNPKYDGYQRGLASMIYTFFEKKKSTLLSDKSAKVVVLLHLCINLLLQIKLHKITN